MSEKTAMQQLLEYIKHNGQSWRGVSADMIEKEFIPIEKEQIENAYWDGGQDVPMTEARCERYYNETYGGEK